VNQDLWIKMTYLLYIKSILLQLADRVNRDDTLTKAVMTGVPGAVVVEDYPE
jgi:hypothetical protein